MCDCPSIYREHIQINCLMLILVCFLGVKHVFTTVTYDCAEVSLNFLAPSRDWPTLGTCRHITQSSMLRYHIVYTVFWTRQCLFCIRYQAESLQPGVLHVAKYTFGILWPSRQHQWYTSWGLLEGACSKLLYCLAGMDLWWGYLPCKMYMSGRLTVSRETWSDPRLLPCVRLIIYFECP